jgi:hypothetical protein
VEQHSSWESFKASGGELLDRVRQIIHEGNVQRVRIRQGDRIVAEFPPSPSESLVPR